MESGHAEQPCAHCPCRNPRPHSDSARLRHGHFMLSTPSHCLRVSVMLSTHPSLSLSCSSLSQPPLLLLTSLRCSHRSSLLSLYHYKLKSSQLYDFVFYSNSIGRKMVFVLRLIPLLVLRSLYQFLFLRTWFPSLFPFLSCLTNPSIYYPSPPTPTPPFLLSFLQKQNTLLLTSALPCRSHTSRTSCHLCCLKSAFTEILLLQQPSPQTTLLKVTRPRCCQNP